MTVGITREITRPADRRIFKKNLFFGFHSDPPPALRSPSAIHCHGQTVTLVFIYRQSGKSPRVFMDRKSHHHTSEGSAASGTAGSDSARSPPGPCGWAPGSPGLPDLHFSAPPGKAYDQPVHLIMFPGKSPIGLRQGKTAPHPRSFRKSPRFPPRSAVPPPPDRLHPADGPDCPRDYKRDAVFTWSRLASSPIENRDSPCSSMSSRRGFHNDGFIQSLPRHKIPSLKNRSHLLKS